MSNYYDQFNQHCADVENYSTNLTVQQAAALWCGIPSEKVSQTLSESRPLRETTEFGKSILVHPNLHCLRTRCEAIQEAIENDEIRVGRDGGKPFLFSESGQVAYSRRTISREELKLWVKKKFPTYLPHSLFNEIERNTHEAITKDVYLAVKAERDKLKNDIKVLESSIQSARNDKEALISENEHLKKLIDSLATPKNTNIQDTNLVIIGAMIESIKERNKKLGKPTSGIQKQLIDYMLEAYPNVTGISESQLQKKFSEANKYIKQIVE
jgi:FtsZ-binding cell division protein ZapB